MSARVQSRSCAARASSGAAPRYVRNAAHTSACSGSDLCSRASSSICVDQRRYSSSRRPTSDSAASIVSRALASSIFSFAASVVARSNLARRSATFASTTDRPDVRCVSFDSDFSMRLHEHEHEHK